MSDTTTLEKVHRLMSMASTAQAYYAKARAWQAKRNTYSVSVSDKERIYADVQEWIMELVPKVNQKAIAVGNVYGRLVNIQDADIQQKIKYEGHDIQVVVQEPASFKDLFGKGSSSDDVVGPPSHSNHGNSTRIFFMCNSRSGQEAVLAKMHQLHERSLLKEARKPRLQVLSGWMSGSGSRLPSRPIESVVLAEGQTERIVKDIQTFLESEDKYARLGIPWHRGYLLYGPPGTGKSSLSKVLAYHFGMDLYYYPLGSAGSDSSMLSALQNVTERSILLLEDVDVFTAMKDRTDQTSGSFTMSGLLNILDGVMTPHGLITIMTTNDKDALDPAILRPGRVDLMEKLSLVEKGQDDRMFEVFYGYAPSKPLNAEGISPSRLMEVFKNNMDDGVAAEESVAWGINNNTLSLHEESKWDIDTNQDTEEK